LTEAILVNFVGYLGALILLRMCTLRARCGSTFAHLFSVVWGVCILAAQFITTASWAVSSATLLILFGAWWCLLLGTLCVLKRQPRNPPRLYTVNTRRAVIAVFVLLVLQAAVVAWELPDLRSVLTVKEVAVVLRVAGIELAAKCPWWLEMFRNAYFVYIPLVVLLRKHRSATRSTVLLVLLASVTLSFSRMTRAPLLGTSVALWASWVLLYRRSAFRAWVAIGAVAGVVAFVFLLSQPMIDSGEGHVLQNVQAVEPYFGGPMRAFETILDGTFPRSPGLYSADMAYYILNKFKLVSSDSYPSIVRPYGDNHTNVYTYLDAFTLDAGVTGAFMGSFLIGLLGGVIFNKASRSNDLVFITAYSSLCYFIAMSILNNEFIRINVEVTLVLAAVVGLIVRPRSPAKYLVRAFARRPIRSQVLLWEPVTRR
jgi:oligosaccharide repeat unit polymerase